MNEQPTKSKSTALKAKTEQYIRRVWNEHDPDALEDLALPEYRRHLGPGQSIDLAAQKERLRGLQRGMPDVRFEVEDLIEEGDRVVFRVNVTGTHQGEMLGVPATGRHVAYTAIDILRFENGKIAEHWGFGDSASLLRQLGALR
jgi:steroid delta-isomerase-like uncharacterized protein